jgi:deoxyribodipyrimidine photo-lyase
MRTIVWFRGKDVRVADHAPLSSALAGGEVIPLFVIDPYFFAPERARVVPHRIQFLRQSVVELERSIRALGSRLLLVPGKSADVVPELARRWKADRVVAQSWVAPLGRERDRRVSAALERRFHLFDGETLMTPGTLRTGAGQPFSVFTPFARAFARVAHIEAPLPAPVRLPPSPADVSADLAMTTALPELAALGIEENPAVLTGGERAARERLQAFLATGASYHEQRDRLDLAGTSRLSADLKFGTLSIREVWHAVKKLPAPARASFTNELVWREFTHSTLYDHPELLDRPFRPQFEAFPWENDEVAWRAWVEGKTGYPVVDASARQLLAEGFVHNRARMISASFLTKHLLVDYRRGEAHYLRYLTDGDWAQNNAGWQWSAGSGTDAQPYFRIFNPVTQGEKFDPEGAYVRRWLPELAGVPDRFVHHPWDAPSPPAAYPPPIVEHRAARERFLALAAQHLG